MILAISPFSNFFTFTVQKNDGGVLSTVNLENIKESYLVFENVKGDPVRISSLISKERKGLNEGVISFLISQNDARRIRSFTNTKYTLTILEQRIDDVIEESPIYEDSWILYEKKAETAYNLADLNLTNKNIVITGKIDSLENNLNQIKNQNSEIQNEILNARQTNSQLEATLLQKEAELAKLIASPGNTNTSVTDTSVSTTSGGTQGPAFNPNDQTSGAPGGSRPRQL